MDKKKMDDFKKQLQMKKQELIETVTQDQSDGRVFDETGTQDLADKATNSYTKEFLFGLSDAERILLHSVDDALTRVREGTYGTCVTCGGPIQAKRLEAIPWACHCLGCQEKLEKEK